MITKLNDKVMLYDYDSYKCNINNETIILVFNNNPTYNKKIIKQFITKKDKTKAVVIKNYNEEIIAILKAIYIEDDSKRYSYIYDEACKLLDNKWNNCFPCKFCNNKCIASQNGFMDKEYDGCCYSFKRKKFGKVKKSKCKFLDKNKKCITKNISCKLFTCNYLKKNTSFNTSYDDYLLLTLFFNKKQKLIIKYNFFKTREQILIKLKEKNYKPYILYLLSFDFVIKD